MCIVIDKAGDMQRHKKDEDLDEFKRTLLCME
jgi:hypothetical protein